MASGVHRIELKNTKHGRICDMPPVSNPGRGAYAEYNVMAIPMALAFVGELYIDLFGRHKKFVHFYCITVLIINMVYYLMRINVL